MIENKKLIIAIGALVLLGFGIEFLKGEDELDIRQGQRLESSDFSKIGDRNFMRSDLNQDTYSETLYLLRPTWSKFDERASLLQEKKDALLDQRNFESF